MLLSLVALAAMFVVVPERQRAREVGPSKWQRAAKVALPIALIALVLVTLRFGRAFSIERLTGPVGIEEDLRFTFYPQVVEIARQFFPFGTGVGSFDPVFRNFESEAALVGRFINQAHSDLLDLAMTTGAAGLALLLIFLLWLGARGVAGFFGSGRNASSAAFVRLGFTMACILLLASLVDYPLRTPFMGAVFAIACGWMCHRPTEPAPRGNENRAG